VVPVNRRRAEFRTRVLGESFTVPVGLAAINISPNSDVPIVARLGQQEAKRFLGLDKIAQPGKHITSDQPKDQTMKADTSDKTKRRGGLAAEGPILPGAPQVRGAEADKIDRITETPVIPKEPTGIYVAVCENLQADPKPRTLHVRTESYGAALKLAAATHPDGKWIVRSTLKDGSGHQMDAVEQKPKTNNERKAVKTKEKKQPKARKGGTNGVLIHGAPITHVLRRCGKEGIEPATIRAYFGKHHKMVLNRGTVWTNLLAGQKGEGAIADLTKAQLDEIKACAPKPEAKAEAKPSRKPATKKKK
jgi:hypothetical protein